MAVRFDAANGRYTATTGLPGADFTASWWAYISTNRGEYSAMLSLQTNTDWRWAVGVDSGPSGNGLIAVSDYSTEVAGSVSRAVGAWYRIAVVASGTTLTLYWGDSNPATPLTSTSGTRVSLAATRMVIGAHTFSTSEWFNGRLANLKIWNATLSETEIHADLAQYAPVRTTSLLRYHPFIDSPVDESGNGHTLTAGSSAVTWEPGPDIPEGGEPEPVDLLVAGARSAARATQPLLAQHQNLPVGDSRSSTRTTRPYVGPFQRPYFHDADWLWDEIPAAPALDPDSAAIANALAQGQHVANTVDFSVALAGPDGITEATPRYDVFFVNQTGNGGDNWGSDPFGSQTMPIPPGLVVPGEYADWPDGHVAVADPTTNTTFNLWQAEDLGTSWRASWGALAPFDGDGREHTYSSTGAGLARYACVIRVDDIAAGMIRHALFFSTDIARLTEYRYPATKTDGSNGAGSPVTIPEGARVQLDPTIDLTAIPGITPAELTIGRALQQYGAYCGDNGGARMAFIFERATDTDDANGVPGQVYQDAGLGWDYIEMSHIPWASLRTLAVWDGGGHAIPITVRPARSATAIDEVTLGQRATVTAHDSRVATRVGAALLDQLHPLAADNARSAITAGTVTIEQRVPLTVSGARAATTVTTPVLVTAGVKDARAESFATNPTLTQDHGPATVTDTVAASTVTTPLLGQRVGLDVAALQVATSAGRATVAHHSPLLLPDTTQATTAADRVTATQHATLTVAGARAATTAGMPLVAAAQDLVIYQTRAVPQATAPLLQAPIIITVRNARSETTVTGPTVEQHAPLAAVPSLAMATSVTRLKLSTKQALTLRHGRAQTVLTRPLLAQDTALHVRGTRTLTSVTLPSLAPPPATEAQNPTGVMILPDFGTVRIELLSLPHTVTVDVNSRIHVFEARGTVLETF